MIVSAINKAQNILITSHIRPDGDSLGSGLALKRFAENNGKRADFLVDSDYPEHYAFLPGRETFNVKSLDSYDLFIAIDCADEKRLGSYVSYLDLPSVNIDHHITNNNFAKVNIVKDYSSSCEILAEALVGKPGFDSVIASLLYVGMSTDTGHFAHSNTNARVLANASRLLEYDFDAYDIVKKLYRSNSIGKTKLIGVAINSMRFYCDNRICIMTITKKDLRNCNCEMSDTEGLIDHALAIRDVETAVCMSEYSYNTYKVSFRSKNVDVSKAAAVFGGGGHRQAAGCMVNGFYEDVIIKILRSLDAE